MGARAFNLFANAVTSFVLPLGVVVAIVSLIMMGSNRLETSLDGKDFEQKPIAPGRFHVGLELTRERQRLVVDVTTPKHAANGE